MAAHSKAVLATHYQLFVATYYWGGCKSSFFFVFGVWGLGFKGLGFGVWGLGLSGFGFALRLLDPCSEIPNPGPQSRNPPPGPQKARDPLSSLRGKNWQNELEFRVFG